MARKRPERITIRLTLSERAEIDAAAAQRDTSRAEILRSGGLKLARETISIGLGLGEGGRERAAGDR